MKIAILDDYQDAVRRLPCFSLLRDHEVKVFHHGAAGLGQLALRLAPFDVLVPIRERTRLPRALLQRLPNLKLIAQTGRLGEHIDLGAARELGIEVAEGGGDPRAPAELTWALIMAAARRIPDYAGLLRQGLWQTSALIPAHNGLGRVLHGRTLGIWGYGKIGQLVAGYGKAFGMPVLVWGSTASRALAQTHGHAAAASKAEFFERAAVVSLHLRLCRANAACVTAADLARMQPDALFVNTSRAALVEQGALEAALDAGRPGFAALDVFEREPLPPDSPLLRRANVLATPHLGYVAHESYEQYFAAAFQKIVDFAHSRATLK